MLLLDSILSYLTSVFGISVATDVALVNRQNGVYIVIRERLGEKAPWNPLAATKTAGISWHHTEPMSRYSDSTLHSPVFFHCPPSLLHSSTLQHSCALWRLPAVFQFSHKTHTRLLKRMTEKLPSNSCHCGQCGLRGKWRDNRTHETRAGLKIWISQIELILILKSWNRLLMIERSFVAYLIQ